MPIRARRVLDLRRLLDEDVFRLALVATTHGQASTPAGPYTSTSQIPPGPFHIPVGRIGVWVCYLPRHHVAARHLC